MVLEDLLNSFEGNQSGKSAGNGNGAVADLLGGLLGSQTSGQGNAMAQLLGGVLASSGNGQSNNQDALLGNALGMLEGLMGTGAVKNNSNINASAAVSVNDPTMALLTPLVDALAVKMKISPQIAMMVVSFAVHQLLSSHPSAGNKGMLDMGSLQQQLTTGQGVNHDYLHSSGLVNQLSKQTGIDPDMAAKSLKFIFDTLGK
ncbi:MAG: hypothetical protein WCP19_02490 [Chloroflexota bacterium]